MLFLSTLHVHVYALAKLFTTNGVSRIKALGNLKMTYNAVLLYTG